MNRHIEAVLFIAWYERQDWSTWLDIVSDPDVFEETYDAWYAEALKAERGLARPGILVKRVPMNVIQVTEWCAARGLPINAAARSRFANEYGKTLYEKGV